MGYKLKNFDFNGLTVKDCYAKINECKIRFQGENYLIEYSISIYADQAKSDVNYPLTDIYNGVLSVNKKDYTEAREHIYNALNKEIAKKDSVENLIFKDAEVL